VIVALGDLVEDVVVELGGPVRFASDTDAHIVRRRGGSAANVAAAAARLGAAARFIGQVGDDPVGASLVDELAAHGVDVRHVRRGGETAVIVVLVDADGERTMLVDRGSSRDIVGAETAWLDGADVVHLTLYSLLDDPIASTSRSLAAIAHDRGVPVSLDLSSIALIEAAGADRVLELVAELRPAVLFANRHEAEALGLDASIAATAVVVKRGPAPCLVHRPGTASVEVPASTLSRPVDTTGAGDAFAAGVLAHPGWRSDLVAACVAGHRAAHELLETRIAHSQ
jgi:sugar/nucleoside kinase (ribokinase family)